MEETTKKESEDTVAEGWKVTEEEIERFMQMVLEGKFKE